MWFADGSHIFDEDDFGWREYVSLKDLSNSTMGYVADDTIKLRVHFGVKVVQFCVLL